MSPGATSPSLSDASTTPWQPGPEQGKASATGPVLARAPESLSGRWSCCMTSTGILATSSRKNRGAARRVEQSAIMPQEQHGMLWIRSKFSRNSSAGLAHGFLLQKSLARDRTLSLVPKLRFRLCFLCSLFSAGSESEIPFSWVAGWAPHYWQIRMTAKIALLFGESRQSTLLLRSLAVCWGLSHQHACPKMIAN